LLRRKSHRRKQKKGAGGEGEPDGPFLKASSSDHESGGVATMISCGKRNRCGFQSLESEGVSVDSVGPGVAAST
jgi:hypothetical protein